tara:strand:+ start:2030 stop:2491 length:462 start_codon:yes stop_codon:yes gene_type:complete
MFECENNLINNSDNRRISYTLKKNFPWFLSENSSLFYHALVFENNATSSFFNLLEPIQDKIKNHIFEACFYLICNKSKQEKIINDDKNIWKENNYIKLIYHIDSSDGYTELLYDKKLDHTQNRGIILDNQLKTCEYNPIKSEYSLLLKVLFKK